MAQLAQSLKSLTNSPNHYKDKYVNCVRRIDSVRNSDPNKRSSTTFSILYHLTLLLS